MTDQQPIDLRHAALGLALWLVTSVYLICNLGHVQLAVTMSTDAEDVAQTYYSRDAQWNEPQSVIIALAAGRNELRFGLPGLLTGSVVRFDPGQRTATYRISSVRWLCSSAEIPVPLDTLINARADASTLVLSAGELVLTARDNDPQLFIPTPGWSARVAGAGGPLCAVLALLMFLAYAIHQRLSPPRLAGVFLGICALFYFAACLFIGPRLPLFDDWRYVLPGPFNLINGSWQWLTVVGNDTYFLTNQVLDFLVLKFSNVDFLWLRGVAAVLLLLQLAMQYRVISRAAQASPVVAAVAVALGIWSLSAGAYWSGTAIAYQQGLPTLFGTLMLVQLVARDGSIRSRVSLSALIACCIASGLAYISGGILIASLGVAYLLAVDWGRAPRSAMRIAAALLGAGVVLLVLQFVLVSIQQGSLLEHNHHSASVYPNDRRFWLFFFALYGRALGYGGVWVPLDVLYTALALFPAVVLGLQRLRALFSDTVSDPHPTWIMLALYAGIGSASYAAIVAFGRAGFASADAAATAITAMGKGRFHFWPVAAMLPYAWLGWAALAQRMRTGATYVTAIVGVLMLAPKSLPLLDHVAALHESDRQAREGARCAVSHLADADAGRPVVCTVLTGIPNDISSTLIQLRQIKSHLYDELLDEGTPGPP
jgi:hypothetical protein